MKLKLPIEELLRFGAVGVASNVVYFAALVTLRFFDWPWWLSTGFSYAMSMFVNYALQRAVTFRSTGTHRETGTRYLVVMLSCLVINSTMMELLIEHVGTHPVVGQVITLIITTGLSYLGQKLWAFRTQNT